MNKLLTVAQLADLLRLLRSSRSLRLLMIYAPEFV